MKVIWTNGSIYLLDSNHDLGLFAANFAGYKRLNTKSLYFCRDGKWRQTAINNNISVHGATAYYDSLYHFFSFHPHLESDEFILIGAL